MGALPSALDDDENTALHYLAVLKENMVMTLFCENGVDMMHKNSRGITPLFSLIDFGDYNTDFDYPWTITGFFTGFFIRKGEASVERLPRSGTFNTRNDPRSS
jgi:hypothetical protein